MGVLVCALSWGGGGGGGDGGGGGVSVVFHFILSS